LPESTPLYPEMLVQEYLQMMAAFREVTPSSQRALISEAVWATGLEERLTSPIAQLSKGFRQRVGIAQAILHKPKLLILDEPTSGLDPTQVDQVRALIQRLSKTTTVLFSTHILTEVEQVCDRAIVLLGGRVRADARLDDLRGASGVVVGVDAQSATASDVQSRLANLPGVTSVRPAEGRDGEHTFAIGGGAELSRAVFHVAKDAGWELAELRPVVRDLDTVFRDLVRQYAAAEEVAA